MAKIVHLSGQKYSIKKISLLLPHYIILIINDMRIFLQLKTHLSKNALMFHQKRFGVWIKTHLRLKGNALAFF